MDGSKESVGAVEPSVAVAASPWTYEEAEAYEAYASRRATSKEVPNGT